MRSNGATVSRQPLLVQSMLVLTTSAVAVTTLLAGQRLGCTTLVAFGIVSIGAALSAGLLLARYGARVVGLVVDGRAFDRANHWLRAACYAALAAYVVANAYLDVAVPRHDADPVSYPGLDGAVAAVVAIAVGLEAKYRLVQRRPSRSLLESLPDDAFYLFVGIVTLGVLVAHACVPGWWLDTVADGLIAALVLARMHAMRLAGPGRPRGSAGSRRHAAGDVPIHR